MSGQNTVNELNPRLDQTVRVFDDFYRFATVVSVNEYDVVNSYFESVFDNAQAAKNFTVAVFRIADETKVPVLTVLEQFQGKSQPEVTMLMAYYLNGIRSPSTLLGANAQVLPNFWAARNILL